MGYLPQPPSADDACLARPANRYGAVNDRYVRRMGLDAKWELYGRETWTMEGDPSIPVIADTWLKGLREFDIETAYEAFHKSATMPGITYTTDTVRKGGALPDSYYALLKGGL